MSKIKRIVQWLCSKFNRQDLNYIILYLFWVLQDRDPEIKPRDHFKEQHPNYRDFYVDPLAPIPKPPAPSQEFSYKDLLTEYRNSNGKALPPVRRRRIPSCLVHAQCKHCHAPAEYLYLNNGKRSTQVRCKVCNKVSSLRGVKRESNALYLCPYCGHNLYRWKDDPKLTIYKCGHPRCPKFLEALNKLNPREQKLRLTRSSQFKLHYQFRVFHFTRDELLPRTPDLPKVDLSRVYNPDAIVGLVLALHVSYGISARKTALMLKQIFQHSISYQTVLNYAEAAAYYCHRFNHTHKGKVDDVHAADEHYIKISGNQAYVFLAISTDNLKISAYHVDSSRDTLPATITLNEAFRTAQDDQRLRIISDGNPSYGAAVHFLNGFRNNNPLTHKKVIGLQNLDEESTQNRPFKQIIERLNRTYKYHAHSACGFKNYNGARSLTALFVTHYNFLRPHFSLDGNVPCPLPDLKSIPTIQSKWCKILDMAINEAHAT